MNVKEEALKLHASGFNCAQSVLGALRDYTGLEDSIALAVCGGFGGGVRCGEICGAASAAVMAIGLAFPHNEGSDLEARRKVRELTGKYTACFKNEFGCIRCVDLKKSGRPCNGLIEYAAQLAENIITENGEETKHGNL